MLPFCTNILYYTSSLTFNLVIKFVVVVKPVSVNLFYKFTGCDCSVKGPIFLLFKKKRDGLKIVGNFHNKDA